MQPHAFRATPPTFRAARLPVTAPEQVAVGGALALHILATPDLEVYGRRFPLTAHQIRVGRDPGPYEPGPGRQVLRIADPLASRLHAVIEQRGREYVWVDAGSTHGARINGVETVERALEPGDVIRLPNTVMLVTAAAQEPRPPGWDLVGDSLSMRALAERTARVATSHLPVLVTGPTGSGKELVARAIHTMSGRRGAFVPVNCAALPDTLVESLLFGHKRGAFTGANEDAQGAFVSATGGTLFLDEIGEITPAVQPKFLRALETSAVIAVGALRPVQVDVRVVAATNRKLDEELKTGRFREDLYARLAGVELLCPSLARRREDVPELFASFLPEQLRSRPWTANFAEALMLYEWPRNVRELRRLAERLSVIHASAPAWNSSMLDDAHREILTGHTEAGQVSWPPKREDLVALLDRVQGNVSLAARLVGRNRKQLYRWMEHFGIQSGTGRD